MNNCKPIDFVITWVDGSDPAWLKEKNKYLHTVQSDIADDSTIDAAAARYRDWDILHYWFRSVEKYAPWVNQIHFVTWGHIPAWLNTEHPKLHIVRHEDYIPAEYLPTFSSHPIELNFHRISGLSEQFVYFNDDVFLTAPTRPEDFFRNGLPCDSISESPISCDSDDAWNHILLNNEAFLNRHFSRKSVRKQNPGKWFSLKSPKDAIKNLIFSFVNRDTFFGFSTHHLHQAYLKSSFEHIWDLEPELLHATCSHRFRSQNDINNYIIREVQLIKGAFEVQDMYKMGHAYHSADDYENAVHALKEQRYKVVCLNDNGDIDFAATRALIHQTFDELLPEKSAFEK